jgi:outer membrane protein insertion porin family
VTFGAGYSTTEALIGDVGLRERNLLGRGQDFRINLTASTKRQQIDTGFTEPYFLDSNVAAGVDAFKRRRDLQSVSGYNEIDQGGALRFGVPLTEEITLGPRYFLRQDRVLDVSGAASRFVQAAAGSTVTSGIGYVVAYDTRDDRIDPGSGVVVRFGQDVAGVGGNQYFVKNTASYAMYRPVAEEVIASLAIQGGYVSGYRGGSVNITNRFFVGGDNFRGFRIGGVGPRDALTGDALGANVFGVGTVELKFPLGLPQELGISGRTFTEFGMATAVDEKGGGINDAKSLRASAGVGLSWRSPFGPIRIDIARPVLREEFDKGETFRFSFGTRF